MNKTLGFIAAILFITGGALGVEYLWIGALLCVLGSGILGLVVKEDGSCKKPDLH